MDVDGVVLDISGVLVDDWAPIAGAAEAVAALRADGLGVVLLTNTTSRARAEVVASLRDAGIDLDDGDVLTAAVATGRHLAAEHPGARCMVLNVGGGTGDLGALELVAPGSGPVDVVVVGSPGPGAFTWEHLSAALEAVQGGAALVGMHRSTKWRAGGAWLLDGGAYLAALEAATGVGATVLGKPEPAMFRAALAQLATEPARTLMVGDSVVSDVLAAQAVGLRGVLVRTGGFDEDDLARADGRPDAVVDDVTAVPGLLGIH